MSKNLGLLLTGLAATLVAGAVAFSAGKMGAPRLESGEKLATIAANATTGLRPVKKAPKAATVEVATFACGCFWGVEQEFRKEPGVLATAVGYSGGHVKNPTYEQVCTDSTGHAEAVRVTFDPKRTSYDKLLALFWDLHDPTTPNRAGPDFGTQYRSVIFYHSEAQRLAAIKSRDKLQRSGEVKEKIVTEIIPAAPLTLAEEYHQQYVEKGGFAVCHRRKSG